MNKRSLIIVGLLLLLALVWIGSGYVVPRDGKTGNEAQSATINVEKDTVTIVEMVESTAQTHQRRLSLSAVTEPSKRSEIKAEVTGKIHTLNATEGQTVNAGDVLMKIEVRDTGAMVAEARAAKSQAQIDYDAAVKLNEKGLSANTAVARAKAALEAANARLIAARTQYANTIIKSPISGVVQAVAVEKGDVVGPNFRTGSGSFNDASSLISIISNEGFHVVADVAETYVSDIKVGQTADVTLYDGREMQGEIGFVSAIADPVTRTFSVEVHLPSEAGISSIVAGASAKISLTLPAEEAHHIPTSYLSLHEGELGVKLVEIQEQRDDGVIGEVQFLPVNMRDNDRDGVWAAGLPPQLHIITLGQGFVKPGDIVKAVSKEHDA